MTKIKKTLFPLLLTLCIILTACSNSSTPTTMAAENETSQSETVQQKDNPTTSTEETAQSADGTLSLDAIPPFTDKAYVVINNNIPYFTDDELSTTSFEHYSNLDSLDRCGVAFSCVGTDIMPTEDRGAIGQVKPTGWHTVKYDCVNGNYLYNRCHLIGYQLTAENANEQNLITGTRYLNIDGMLAFENMCADYVKETGNHILYRVTPIFVETELVARGVEMEAYSVEDEGEGICYNVYCYNNQPGVTIDYATGESWLSGEGTQISHEPQLKDESATEDATSTSNENVEVRGNSKSKIYHCLGQTDYDNMADSENLVVFQTEQEAINAGYRKAKR